MINLITDNLKTSIASFLTTNYTASTGDINKNSPVFIDPSFNPDDEKTYAKLGVTDYVFIIVEKGLENEVVAPYPALKERYTADIIITRSFTGEYDATNRKNIVTQGRTSTSVASKVTSITSIATNLAKHFRANKITDCYWNDIVSTDSVKTTGIHFYVVCSFEALRMEQRTITV